MRYGDTVPNGYNPMHYWKALNTIAYFILEGNIELSGVKDCFKKLTNPKSGAGSVNAGDGIFIQPKTNIHTFGKISDETVGLPVENVHISSEQRDTHGRATNTLVLKEGDQYHVAGDCSLDFSHTGYAYAPADKERLICHRGRLREAGFEIPGPIHKNELWLIDRSGKFASVTSMFDHMWPCSGCYESMCRREWPTPEMCRTGNNNCNGKSGYIPRMRKKGVKPAVPEFECARSLVARYFRPGWSPVNAVFMKAVKKVLDASFTIRDWDQLAEASGVRVNVLAMLFCAVPSLGERLDKRGASFVPWAGDTGLYLGTHARVGTGFCKEVMYEESDDGVIEIYTGEKVRFEEDHNGIIHVERTMENYSDRIPEGVDGYLYLG